METRSGRLRSRPRRRRVPEEPINLEDNQMETSCIDLTEDDHTDHADSIVDLTAVTNSPIVIGNSQPENTPVNLRQRLRRERTSDRSGSGERDEPFVLPDLDLTPTSDETAESSAAGPTEAVLSSPENQSSDQAIRCPVCLDSINQIKRDKRKLLSTVCGHLFCDTCIHDAINLQHRCPSCRKKLTMRQIHPIFI